MWPIRSRSETETVTCIACDATVDREGAREYDKHGNRWEREGKRFEYLCTPCHDALCHHSRDELEELLVEIEAGSRDREAFLSRYYAAVEARYGSLEEQRGRD